MAGQLEVGAFLVLEMAPHQRIAGRMTGRVAVTLSEGATTGRLVSHGIMVQAWTDTLPGMDEIEIEAGLLACARRIVDRLVAISARAA
jgi:hypothetical protein